jgi:hypothetical protein
MEQAKPMKRKQFTVLVEGLLKRMDRGEKLDDNQSVAVIRAWNTIEHEGSASRNPSYARFVELVWFEYLERIAQQLDATVNKGMVYYVPKRDLYLGGFPHENSRFQIEDN